MQHNISIKWGQNFTLQFWRFACETDRGASIVHVFLPPSLNLCPVLPAGPKGPGGMSITNNYCRKCHAANKKMPKSGLPYSACQCTSESLLSVSRHERSFCHGLSSAPAQLTVERKRTGPSPAPRSCSAPPPRATLPPFTASRTTTWRSQRQTPTGFLTATDRAKLLDKKKKKNSLFFNKE